MTKETKQRPPVVSVMGHVDHGKSAILDYIRKTNVVAQEAGGITQHVSAYEVKHEYEGNIRKITFLDTPGHEAFKKIRKRGATAADIAILVVASDDGVKQQTLDALSAIKEAGIPFIVAINKIDLPNANIQKTQSELIENEVYIEGMGGDIPWVAVSAKTGEGMDSLLDTILLLSDLQELTASSNTPASGVVIETRKDPKRGILATLLIKEGVLHTGDFVVAEDAWAPVRIFEDFKGEKIQEATFSSPVVVVGFNKLPELGVMFKTVKSKKEAEKLTRENEVTDKNTHSLNKISTNSYPVNVIVIADTVGSKEAILYELSKLSSDKSHYSVLRAEVGILTKDDAELALTANALILLFGTKIDNSAKEIIRQNSLEVEKFDVIYNLSDFAKQYILTHTPKKMVETEIGRAKVIKIFSESNRGYVLGGKVKSGKLKLNGKIKILRRENELGFGTIKTLQSNKQDMQEVQEGEMYGALIKTNIPLAEGDILILMEDIEV